MEESVSDYRKKIFALREKLSPEIVSKINEIAPVHLKGEKWYLELLLRKAVGNSLPEPTDITGCMYIGEESLSEYKRLWNILESKFEREETLNAFEKTYLNPVLVDEEASLPQKLSNMFVDRISKETSDLMLRLDADYQRSLTIPPNELRKIVLLKELAFNKYEKDVLQSSLKQELERVIEEELIANGLASHVKDGEKIQERKFKYRELSTEVQKWAKKQKFQKGVTIESKKIALFVRELQTLGYIHTSENTIRAKLSKLGYSEEKVNTE